MPKNNSFSNASTSSGFDSIRRPSLIDAELEILNESQSTLSLNSTSSKNAMTENKGDTMLRIIESNEDIHLA